MYLIILDIVITFFVFINNILCFPQLFLIVPFYDNGTRDMCQESGEKEEYFMTSTYKQLSFDERLIIQNLLSDPNITLKMIALTLNRSPKAIRYEITHHLRIVVRANTYNKCGRQNQCDHTRLCTHCLQGHCKFCKHDNCNDLCPDFISTPICKHTSRFPYVCNNCPDAKTCKLPKVFYMADIAQKQRDDNVSSWKEGPKKLRYVKMELAGHACSTVIQWPLGRKEV